MGSIKKSLPGAVKFEVAENGYESNEGFVMARMRIAYPGENANGSVISKDVFNAAVESMTYCPVVCRYDRETDSIGSHDVEVVIKDKQITFVNATHPVGVVPVVSDTAWETVKDGDTEHEYLATNVLLWKREEAFAHICEVGEVDVSMECYFEEYSVQDDGLTYVDKLRFDAFCLLESAMPCYEGASLCVFEAENLDSFEQRFSNMVEELSVVESSEVQVEDVTVCNDIASLCKTIIAEDVETNEVYEVYDYDDEYMYVSRTVTDENVSRVTTIVRYRYDVSQSEDGEAVYSLASEGENVNVVFETQEEAEERANAFEENKALKEQMSVLENEINELKEFKKARVNEDKRNIMYEFSVLEGNEEFEVIKNNLEKFETTEDLKNSLFAILGKQSFAKQEVQHITVPIDSNKANKGKHDDFFGKFLTD